MCGMIFVGEIVQKQEIWCLKCMSLNINFLFTFVTMLTFGENNGTLHVILTV